MTTNWELDSVEDAIAAIARGEAVVVVDDEDALDHPARVRALRRRRTGRRDAGRRVGGRWARCAGGGKW
jgi:hypothetical protein